MRRDLVAGSLVVTALTAMVALAVAQQAPYTPAPGDASPLPERPLLAQAQPSEPAPQSAPAPQSSPSRFATPWSPLSAADAERAAQAAIKAVGGGTVHDVDRSHEGGAAYEVELTTPDGRSLEVQLGPQFDVLSTGDERDANERADDGEDRGEREDDD